MREHRTAVFQKRRTVFADFAANLYIRRVQRQRTRSERGFERFDGLCAAVENFFHFAERPREVDRRGTGGF